ncbi:MAG: hypothetical protein R3250_16455 [Melioribacteraceae bacterium]|nr:hypothetical protein [Melioribacteraceae bacterium]
MKKSILLFLLVGITFLGCDNNSDNAIVSTKTNIEKETFSNYYVSELVDGEIGGWVTVSDYYINTQGQHVTLYLRLRILPGSYQGIRNIEMILNPEDASIQFYPEMTFTRDVRLDLWYKGIDLQAMGYTLSGDVDFAYFADNGDIELIENTKSSVDIRKNKIEVRNAKLSHFSRYGWIR